MKNIWKKYEKYEFRFELNLWLTTTIWKKYEKIWKLWISVRVQPDVNHNIMNNYEQNMNIMNVDCHMFHFFHTLFTCVSFIWKSMQHHKHLWNPMEPKWNSKKLYDLNQYLYENPNKPMTNMKKIWNNYENIWKVWMPIRA